MRKLSFLLLPAIFLVNSSIGQKDSAFASVQYSFIHIIDTTQPDNPLKENMILFLGKNMSNYNSYDKIERAALIKAGGKPVPTETIINGRPVEVVQLSSSYSGIMLLSNSYFKDQASSKLKYLSVVNGRLFSVEEKNPVIEWSITQETKEIQGMRCQKATGDFKGRTYEAWFCSQFPYTNGPWKLGGLPGLIVEAYDTKREVMFLFTSFENANGAQTSIAIPADAIKTTPKEYRQYQEALQKDRGAMAGNSNGDGGGNTPVSNVRVTSGPAGGTVTGSDGKQVRMRRMNNPIEKKQQ